MRQNPIDRHTVHIPSRGASLPGDLAVPAGALGLVIFAHGSGSSRLSPRGVMVAGRLNDAGLATLLFDLLTPTEAMDKDNVYSIPLLAARLQTATEWAHQNRETSALPIGYFGASTGAAAALWAAADQRSGVRAVVSRGGRPDLARSRLPDVTAPTLLIVGGRDPVVLELNRGAMRQLRCEARLRIVPGAAHLFEEPGALEMVANVAAAWFGRHLGGDVRGTAQLEQA